MTVWRADPKVIAAGTMDGVFLSRDGGEHWARISPASNRALMPVVSLEFDPTDSRILFAGTPHLPWKTTDGGATWQSVHTGMRDDSDVFSIHVDPNHPSRVFASACSGLYCSLNHARSWTKLVGARDASYRTYQITQDPAQPSILFAGTTHGLVRSSDGGKSWHRLSSYATRWVEFDPERANRIYIATDEAGLFRSDNLGDSLLPINEGFCNRHVDSLAAVGATLFATLATSQGGRMYRNVNLAANWQDIDSVSPRNRQPILKIVPVDGTRLYALATKKLLLSTDAGRTWMELPGPNATTLTTVLAPTPGRGRLLVGTDTGIYYTEDEGQRWLKARTPQPESEIRLLAALSSGLIAAITSSAVWISSDAIDYHAIAPPASGSEVYGLVSTGHAELLAATSYGLRRSTDLGANWQPVPGVLGGTTVSAICNHPTRPGVLFASQYGTIFGSVDNGSTWTAITSPSHPLPSVQELVVAPGIPAGLFAVTRVQGVYAVPIDPQSSWTECCELRLRPRHGPL